MQPSASVADITTALLEQESLESLAAELSVSASSVRRWAAGSSAPRPADEGRLRALHEQRITEDDAEVAPLDIPLGTTLAEVREALHRHGRLSSRAEAVDEIAKLLFAHVYLILTRDTGLDGLASENDPASALRNAVTAAYSHGLPQDLTNELRAADFDLRLSSGEDALARDICKAFSYLTPAEVRAALADPVSADFLNGVFGAFLADSFADERNMGQYLTPPEVVDAMVSIGLSLLPDATARWLEGDRDAGLILDPSCGAGSFLIAASRRLLAQKTKSRAGGCSDWLEQMVAEHVVGSDKSERMVRLGITNFALLGAKSAPVHLANALDRQGSGARLTEDLEGKASLILTNPPFGAEFSTNDLVDYRIASTWATSTPKKVDSELLFIERYMDWLEPGGVALAIVPDSILTNKGLFEDLRRVLSVETTIEAVVSLPSETFAAAGTTTKTSILAFRKGSTRAAHAYVALCKHVGFAVSTRASMRQRSRHGQNDLLTVETEVVAQDPEWGRRIEDLASSHRWDASYHASLPRTTERLLHTPAIDSVFVRDVATLVNQRSDPRRSGQPTFRYIEISDVDGERLTSRSKSVPTAEAPSRARKRVSAGDILVATVRPERRAIGVVSSADDGAICSTGFAVLRPIDIDPYVLASLLRTEFATTQLVRHSLGVSYPAIDEQCLPDVLLPAQRAGIIMPARAAVRMQEALAEYEVARSDLEAEIAREFDRFSTAS